MKVLVLGAGKMVGAILKGLQPTQDFSNWYIFSPSGVSAKELALKVNGQWLKNLDEGSGFDWVIIGCKPQQLHELKALIGPRFQESTYISLLAAIPEETQRQVLGVQSLLRVMPNIAVEYGAGVTLLSSKSVPEEKMRIFQKLFNHLGKAYLVKEIELEELTLLTGSGPALFFEFTNHLTAAFHSLTELERQEMARAVLYSSAIMAQKDSRSLCEMINAVTSKSGVTIAALEGLRSVGFAKNIKEAIDTGKARSLEIKKIFTQN